METAVSWSSTLEGAAPMVARCASMRVLQLMRIVKAGEELREHSKVQAERQPTVLTQSLNDRLSGCPWRYSMARK
jgi:hypothetical protein